MWFHVVETFSPSRHLKHQTVVLQDAHLKIRLNCYLFFKSTFSSEQENFGFTVCMSYLSHYTHCVNESPFDGLTAG